MNVELTMRNPAHIPHLQHVGSANRNCTWIDLPILLQDSTAGSSQRVHSPQPLLMENTMRKIVVGFALFFALLGLRSPYLWAAPLTAAIEISPGVFLTGDNTTRGQEGTIVLLGVSQKVTNTGGTSAGTGRAVFGDLVMSKNLDRTSPLLMLGAALGFHLATVTIRFYNDQVPLTNYYTIVLNNVIITSIDTVGSPAGTQNTSLETLSLSFTRISLRDELHGIATCWDVASNAKC